MQLAGAVLQGSHPVASPDTITTIDIVNLVIAGLGFTLALIALVWRVVEWRLGGSVVRLKLQRSYPLRDWAELGDPYITITAHNVGRTAVQVQSWGLHLPDDILITPIPPLPEHGPSCPFLLNPGHEVSWRMRQSEVEEVVPIARRKQLRAVVDLGTGKRVFSKDPPSFDSAQPSSEGSPKA